MGRIVKICNATAECSEDGREGGCGDGRQRADVGRGCKKAAADQAEAALVEWSAKPEAYVLVVLPRLDVQQTQGSVHDDLVERVRHFVHQTRWSAPEHIVQLHPTTDAEEQRPVLHAQQACAEAAEEGSHRQR
jgi:hypothetical protein